MLQKQYSIGLNTPAFLGNADQTAQWRTPPLKSLIRRWWRVLKAKEFDYNYGKIREAEGRIFGHTDLKNGTDSWAMKSQIRLVLSNWDKGKGGNWPVKELGSVQASKGSPKINSGVYMGFGPINFKSKQPDHPWLNDTQSTDLTIQSRSNSLLADDIDQIFYLIDWMGAIGSRSTNAWGSLHIKGVNFDDYENLLHRISRPLEECLHEEWGHAIGIYDGWKSIWETKAFDAWEQVINKLSQIMATLRSYAKSRSQDCQGEKKFSYIHLLGLPTSGDWILPNTARWPCQIKMKVYRDDEGLYKGMIYHLPHAIPQQVLKDLDIKPPFSLQEQANFWLGIHKLLDEKMAARYE